jgi:hypothetical protein
MTLTKEFIDKFNEAVDINKEYTKNELCIILNTVYKEIYSKNNNKKEKRPPTKYNIFVSENMKKMKDKYPELNRQELMKKIGELWKKQKNQEDKVEIKQEEEIEEEENKEEENKEEENKEEEKKPKKKVTKKDK